MQTLSKRLVAAVLTSALLLPTVSAAEAGPRDGWRNNGGWHERHRPHRKHHKHHKHRKHKKNNDNIGAAVAAGVIGLAAGAILLGATSQPSRAAPPVTHYPPNYYPPAPYPGHVSGPVGYQPWSPAWYQYCSSKYRSFNPSTGTYTTYRGVQRFCQ
ncbi:BA14K family protein [Roseibium denhamense]|uniref:Lectin-like protein BA14k n=1 Tax=Roseibium denhamense TaxID=76305 RepID=A0ABY1NBD4_9HYPH|nr:BA14K family protein [Roseibium denhamense]MTI06597.1 BA14K family protein [Roseibium denhamense]SMP05549.1 BA14K-like protein [Roseibium denhamense]